MVFTFCIINAAIDSEHIVSNDDYHSNSRNAPYAALNIYIVLGSLLSSRIFQTYTDTKAYFTTKSYKDLN